jgi:phosphoglycolate phosphatase
VSACIVFDLDGTLIDSAPDIQAIANAVLTDRGTAPFTLPEIRSFIGEGIQAFVTNMRAARDVPESEHERLLGEVIARYDNAVTRTVAYPGVFDALGTLARNHRLGICTNKLHRPCMAVLRHLEIDTCFASVWGGDNPLGRKPGPAPLLAVFEELGEGPRLFVGDSEVDAETAARAGVPFLLFSEGYRKKPTREIAHAAVFDDFKKLPELVARLTGG